MCVSDCVEAPGDRCGPSEDQSCMGQKSSLEIRIHHQISSLLKNNKTILCVEITMDLFGSCTQKKGRQMSSAQANPESTTQSPLLADAYRDCFVV